MPIVFYQMSTVMAMKKPNVELILITEETGVDTELGMICDNVLSYTITAPGKVYCPVCYQQLTVMTVRETKDSMARPMPNI